MKGYKVVGKGGVKKHRKLLRNIVEGNTKSSVRRLARQGGRKLLSGLIREEVRVVLQVFLENVPHKMTVTALYVLYDLELRLSTLYSFGR